MLLNVSILSPKEVIFEGTAKSVILPGEEGVFEILPFHKRFMSRLVAGIVYIDEQSFRIRRGIMKADQTTVTVIIEE